ncbi:MAG: sigma-70 family RNA polymerase sigma factor [Alphaproteobacteria bacterium]|nr:sigma-70 family RNA polymerase sigma factor [Alphaproteobacteria bacterium]
MRRGDTDAFAAVIRRLSATAGRRHRDCRRSARGRFAGRHSRPGRQEIRRAIESALDALPAPFRTVFVLRAMEQLSTREAAAALGIPQETVKTRFHRANRLLRESLSEHFGAIWDDAFPFPGARCDRIVANVLARLLSAGIGFSAAGSA